MWNGGIGRAFSPFRWLNVVSRGAAPVWYGFGPLALAICSGLVWVRAFGPCYLLRSGMGLGFWPLLFAPGWYGFGLLALAGEVSRFP